MEGTKGSRGPRCAVMPFNGPRFLHRAGVAKTIVEYGRGETIFTQGDDCDEVLYIQTGGVELSVRSKVGREAIVATLGPGDFFGEACLAGEPIRMRSATALTPSSILLLAKAQMVRLLHEQHEMSDWFIAYLLSRQIRIEQDLAEPFFNSSEKRLARALLLLARYGTEDEPARVLPPISRAALAEMTGTTRVRVTFFLNKFRRLRFIERDGQLPIKINDSLLSVVLRG